MGWVHMASGSPSVLICLQHSDDQKYMTLLMCGTEKSKRILRGHLYHTSLFFKQVKLSSKRPWDPPKIPESIWGPARVGGLKLKFGCPLGKVSSAWK